MRASFIVIVIVILLINLLYLGRCLYAQYNYKTFDSQLIFIKNSTSNPSFVDCRNYSGEISEDIISTEVAELTDDEMKKKISVKLKQFVDEFNEMKPRFKENNLKTVLLAINFNYPYYDSIPVLKEMYACVFGKVIFCGDKPDDYGDIIVIDETYGRYGYQCLSKGIHHFPHFTGYMYSNDDLLLNWWNFLDFDLTKIWIGAKLFDTQKNVHIFGGKPPKQWHWWKSVMAAEACEKSFKELSNMKKTQEGIKLNLEKYFSRYYKNTKNKHICMHAWSDFVYIPQPLSKVYETISNVFFSNKLFLEVAVPMTLYFLLTEENFINLKGTYYNREYNYSEKYLSGIAFYETFSLDLNFSHPFKLGHKKLKGVNTMFMKNILLPIRCKVLQQPRDHVYSSGTLHQTGTHQIPV